MSFKYKTQLIDYDYYRKQISCQDACPVHTDARGYINDILDGQYEQGYIRARQPNPLGSTCGRVCNAPCESACRRGKIDAPISIRALKRFVCERYGVEAMTHLPVVRIGQQELGSALMSKPANPNSHTVESVAVLAKYSQSRKINSRMEKVAVIGAGPAGLAAAHDLALLGYQVTIFEAADIPGGMLFLGVPAYRLPREFVRFEMNEILDLGVELKLNMRLGQDFTISSLRQQGYEAIFLGIGSHKDRRMGVEGEDMDGVLNAIEFLLNVNKGFRADLGTKILIVGGGAVAIDAARSAYRLEVGEIQPEEGDGVVSIEAAREALRRGARDVHIIYRGSREEMKAPDEEVEDALVEGIHLHTGLAPKRIIGKNGKIAGLETLLMRSEVDSTGVRRRSTIPGTESLFECESIIVAVGQESDLSWIRSEDGIKFTPQGTISVNPETLATTAQGIYAGGDVVFGPRIIIEAERDGHTAARSIHSYLRKGKIKIVKKGWMTEVKPEGLPQEGYLDILRQRPPVLSLDRRVGVTEVEQVYSEDKAREQAKRCLKCHIQTVFNSDLCILCGGCADICPVNCYKLVKLDKIAGDERLKTVVKERFNMSLDALDNGDRKLLNLGTAIIKDDDHCIRCGLCARRCPTQAITMEAFWFEEEIQDEKSSSEKAAVAWPS